jgi:predicted transcriptional regulator
VASLGELERAVMELLWAADEPLAAPVLQAELRDRGVALTTVHTVLTRLEQKGFVVHDGGRPRRFGPTASREQHAAELMHEVLGSSGDRQAVLARFVGSVDPDEARLLRELLDAAGD